MHSLVGTERECALEIRITSVQLRLVISRRITLGKICRFSEPTIRTTEGIIMVPSLNMESSWGMSNRLQRFFESELYTFVLGTVLYVRSDKECRVAVYAVPLCRHLHIIRHTSLVMSLQFCVIFAYSSHICLYILILTYKYAVDLDSLHWSKPTLIVCDSTDLF